MDSNRLTTCAVAMWLFVFSISVFAQRQGLSDDILTAPGPLSPQQTEKIETYAKYWSDVLCRGESPDAIAEARDRLLGPFRAVAPPTSDVVKDALASAAAAMLNKCSSAKDPVVRMNALIVVAELPTSASDKLIIASLTDANQANRYWAAKSIAELSRFAQPGQSLFTQAQQDALLAAMKKAMPGETSDVVLEQMYRALGALTIVEAQDTLLDILDQRVAAASKQITGGLRADKQGLLNLYTRLVVQQAVGNNVAKPLHRLTAISGKYLLVVATALQAKKVDAELVPACLDVVDAVEEIFKYSLKTLDPAHAAGPELSAPAKGGNFAALLLATLDWVGDKNKPGILSTSAIGIAPEELKIGG
ncbi:MAG: hypothetical protein GC162_09555 [Planctomycetes bacterium]|nr:hypothetical protein [Planctomycetota bacterium]